MKELIELIGKHNELEDRVESLEALEFTMGAACPSGAPVSATYLTMQLEAALTAERVLTAGAGILLNDGGPEANATLSLDDHAHDGVAGDGGQISHDTALTGVSPDDHHAQDHKDRHDPEDGADALDTAIPVDTGIANALGNSHSYPRADHVHKLHDHLHAGVAGDGGEIPVTSLNGYIRGSIFRGGVADWEVYNVKTNHFILVGDGTDIISKAFDWDDMAAGAGADMVHNHSAASEGGEIPLTSIGSYAQGSIILGGAADWETLVRPGVAGYALISNATSMVWDQTPSWTGKHSFVAGIGFTGASDANEITIPDNTAIALELLDAGGLEYMRVNSTNANPYILLDPAKAGINVGIGIDTPLAHLHEYHGAAYAVGDGVRTDGYYPNFQLYCSSTNAAARNWAIIGPWIGWGGLDIRQSNAKGGDPINAGTSRLTIRSDGDVGINDTSPGTKLEVVGTITATKFTDTGGGYDFFMPNPSKPNKEMLRHWAIETDGMRTLYTGTGKTNNIGKATIELPEWFAGLAEVESCTLTPVNISGELIINLDTLEVTSENPRQVFCWLIIAKRVDKIAQNTLKTHPIIEMRDKDSPKHVKYVWNEISSGDMIRKRGVDGPPSIN